MLKVFPVVLGLFFSSVSFASIHFSYIESEGDHLKVFVSDGLTQLPLSGVGVITHERDIDLAQSLSAITGANGEVEVPVAGFSSVTVMKEGFVPVSLAGVKAGLVQIRMQRLINPEDKVLAKGTLSGWQPVPSRDFIQVGLVFRSLNALDLFFFQMDSLISPLNDKIDIFGPQEIPSNFVLPEQNVNFLFTSIYLNKPVYTLPLQRGFMTRLVALQGQVRVRDVTNPSEEYSVDFLNRIKFKAVGITSAFSPTTDLMLDIPADQKLVAKHQVIVSNPPFEADVLTAAVGDFQGDRQFLVPTDVKAALSKDNPEIRPVNLLASSNDTFGKARLVVTAALGSGGKRVSGIINDNAEKNVRPGEFLPVELISDFTAVPESISFAGFTSGLSSMVFENSTGAAWFVYALPGAEALDVRTSGLSKGTIKKYAISQLNFATGFNPGRIDGNVLMKDLSKFTKSTANISN